MRRRARSPRFMVPTPQSMEASMVRTARPTETPPDLAAMYDALLARDDVLRAIADEHGRPDPFTWAGQVATSSNFAALILHIVGQQISTTVALVLFGRLEAAVGG